MDTQNEDQDVFQSEYFDPFPQPQTIPSGWDLSGLFPTPVPDSVEQAVSLRGANDSEQRSNLLAKVEIASLPAKRVVRNDK